MRSNHIMTRRFGAALVVAVVVLVSALGCASDDDSATTEAATGATGYRHRNAHARRGNREPPGGPGAALSRAVGPLGGPRRRSPPSGTEAGQDALAAIGSTAAALADSATSLTEAGADEAASAAEDLASSLESLAASGGEDAQARAGEAADGVQQLTDALQCP